MKSFTRSLLITILILTFATSVLLFAACKHDEKYTVTFDSNGGTAVDSIEDVLHGSLIAEPSAPTRLGHTFGGWYSNSNLTKPWKFDSDKVTSNITLYAKWTYNETVGLDMVLNGTEYTVRGIGSVKDYADLVIPETYKGLPVTTIAEKAFEETNSLQTVFIPESVTSIKSGAFRNCANLTSVVIAGQSSELGEQVFYKCANLTEVNLPENITSIEKELFLGCEKLASITIPATVTSIGDKAFSMCKAITEIRLPASLRSLGENVFSGCIGIEKLSVDGGNPYFYSRENNNDLNCIIEISSAGNKLVVGCKNSVIPASAASPVKVIGQGAFYGCTSLTGTLEIPSGVEVIEDDAFQYCSGIESVFIPASVTRIGDRAFSSCESLTAVTFREPSESSEYTGIEDLGQEAFSHTSLIGIHLPSSLKRVGRGLFCGCDTDRMTSVTYGADVNNLLFIMDGLNDENSIYDKVITVRSSTNGSVSDIRGLA